MPLSRLGNIGPLDVFAGLGQSTVPGPGDGGAGEAEPWQRAYFLLSPLAVDNGITAVFATGISQSLKNQVLQFGPIEFHCPSDVTLFAVTFGNVQSTEQPVYANSTFAISVDDPAGDDWNSVTSTRWLHEQLLGLGGGELNAIYSHPQPLYSVRERFFVSWSTTGAAATSTATVVIWYRHRACTSEFWQLIQQLGF